ncbi:MAG: hypothetical protein AB2807_08065 [Candidatus Sedimenticola endophacoides]
MKIAIGEEVRKRAKLPHDLYMTNMFLLNIPMVAATLAYTIGGNPVLVWAVLGTLLCSLGVIGYIRWRAGRIDPAGDWFTAVHWRLSARRGNLLLIGYLATGLIIGLGVLVGSASADPNMRTILLTIFTRIGIVPGLVLILVTTILEGQAMHLVNNGIVPRRLAERHPPPPGTEILDEASE